MTRVVWDKIEDRRYETGIDRGLIQLVDSGICVPWNGLVSVAEDNARDLQEGFQEGVKVFQRLLGTSYSAKIQAFTYPDELEELLGKRRFAPGVNLHDQTPGRFHLSYRTLIGDASGEMAHYKLHVIWNLLIRQDGTQFQSLGATADPNNFGFSVTAMPIMWNGPDKPIPINHMSIDSREVDPALLATIEDDMYGTDVFDGYITDPEPFIGYFTG